jgi:hypothetical protein
MFEVEHGVVHTGLLKDLEVASPVDAAEEGTNGVLAIVEALFEGRGEHGALDCSMPGRGRASKCKQ